jgi:hypothetical protein
MRALENTMPIIKEATYNFLVKFSGKDEMKKGLAQCKGDFCLEYILQYISKDVPFN